VVYTTRRNMGGNARNGVKRCQARCQVRAVWG